VYVGTTITPTTLVGGLLSPSYVGDRPTVTRDYHGQASFVVGGKKVRSVSLPCDYETGDAGQTILHASWVAETTIYVKYVPDDANGEILPVTVSHEELGSADANGVQTISWTLNQAADPTLAGTGFSA